MSSRKTGRAYAAKIEHRRAVARRRGQQIRWEELRQMAAEQRRQRRKKLAIGFAAIVVLAAAVTTYLVWPEPEVKLELTSPVVAKQSPPLTISTAATAYNVTYQIQVISADTGTVERHLEKLSVRRPFDDHVIFYAGDAVTDTPEFEVIDNLGLASTISGGVPQVQQGLPAAGKTDVRLDITLDDLVKSEYFTAREQRRVAGRNCTVYRTGRTVESNSVAKATDTDYVDVCVDESGLMLEEMAVNSGKISLRVIATDIAFEPAFADDAFTISDPPLGTADGAPVLEEIDKATIPNANLLRLPTVPEGFEHKARYVLREAPSADAAATGVAPTKDTYVDVYVNGTKSIVIQQGPTDNEPQIDTTDAQTIDIGLLGQAKMLLGISGNTVVVNPTGMWFIHVNATLPTADLQTLAGQLR
ncbi:MAG: hypothetical protein ABI658_29410 [Acidimicrobiales bacterium]